MSCPVGSYCKWWQDASVCQGTNTPCSIPGMKYSCANQTCVQDPKNGLYDSCHEANCTDTTPRYCCNPEAPGTTKCGLVNGSCPSGYTVVSDCSKCGTPDKTVFCCDQSQTPAKCGPYTNTCPESMQPVSSCDECKSTDVYVKCCDSSIPSCSTQLNNCSNGTYEVSDCAYCTSPLPPPTQIVSCCSKTQCLLAPIACPAGFTQVDSCDDCKIECCDTNAWTCNTYSGKCPQGTTAMPCSSCNKPTPANVSCCNTTTWTCKDDYPGTCPPGLTQMDCSKCVNPNPTMVDCCDTSSWSFQKFPGKCPQGYVPMSQEQCVAPPSGSCPLTQCAQGGFPIVMWSEHPPIGDDPTSPAVIQYFQNVRNFICNSNPAGLCVTKFLLRLEVPVSDKGVHNCFYPEKTNPLYTELLQYIPDGVTMYALPYISNIYPWVSYPDTPDGQAFYETQKVTCGTECAPPPCPASCPAGYQCLNGDCWQSRPDSDCDGCGFVQKCWINNGAVKPKCVTECHGMCCNGTSGLCCSDSDIGCSNDMAKAVWLVKSWNDLMGKELFKGIIVDAEGTGWGAEATIRYTRAAMKQLGVNYKVGTTYDGSGIAKGADLLTRTDDTRTDEMYPEVYNLTTACNRTDLPWPTNSQLVDSYFNPTIGGCTTVPYPAANSLYAQAWKTSTPAQTLWNGNGVQNFYTILKHGWGNAVLTQDVANRIFPLLSVETSGDSNINTCSYPAGSGDGPCGTPNAFGVWNTTEGAQQFIQFVKLLSQNMPSVLGAGSAVIPITNFGIFSFPLLPKAWTNWTV